jgi:hypothetical protein
MRLGGIHQHDAAFADRDSFLFAVLGLISWGERADRLLERLKVETAPPAASVTRDVYVVLGLISAWQRAERELKAWAPKRHRSPPESGPMPPPFTSQRELAR